MAATGCSGSGDRVSLSGALEKGPFVLGSSVRVTPLDHGLDPTGEVYDTRTVDDAGRFAIDFDETGVPVSIEGSGFYYNEVTGSLSVAPIVLRALDGTIASGEHQAFLNVVTHLAYERARTLALTGMGVREAEAAAEAELRRELHVGPAGFDPGKPGLAMTILGGNNDPSAYLLAVSAVLVQAAIARGGPVDSALQELLNTLAVDLAADGRLDPASVDALLAAQRAVDPELVMARLGDRLAAIGSTAVVPNINRFIDSDLDDVVNRDDNCRSDANPDQLDTDGDGIGNVCDDDARLAGLVPSIGTLEPAFSPARTDYHIDLTIDSQTFSVTPTVADPAASIEVNGVLVASGTASPTLTLARGRNPVNVVVTAPDAMSTRTYTIIVNRGSDDASLIDLVPSVGTLSPVFAPGTAEYQVDLALATQSFSVTPTTSDPDATITVNGAAVASGSASSAIDLDYGPNVVTIVVTAPDGATTRTYSVSANRVGIQQAYLKASNTGADDGFGYTISVSGDTLVVGAMYEDSGSTGIDGDQLDDSASAAGAVYVFTRVGSAWTQQAYLKASNAEAGDYFGTSVSLSGDTLAVGALGERSNATGVDGDQSDNSAPYSGAVYVFTRSGTTWSQQAYIKASNTEDSDTFGYNVSLSGDTLAVGTANEDSGATGVNGDQTSNARQSSGAVYVFTRTGTAWSQQAYIKASNTDSGDVFGDAIALSGDTLVVGAWREDSPATGVNGDQGNDNRDSGAAYVFRRTGATWAQEAYLKASNTETDDAFGLSVSVSGDTVAVGAVGEDSSASGVDGDQSDYGASNSGAVYVFTRAGTTWSQQAYVKASDPSANGGFGYVSVSANTLLVGAPGQDGNRGAAYVFGRTGTTWSQEALLKASYAEFGDGWGARVCVDGDTFAFGAGAEDSSATGVNGDQTDNAAPNSGAAYVFR